MKPYVYGVMSAVLAGIGVMAVLSGWGPSLAHASANPIRTSVTVTGTSTTMVTPTEAQITLGVSNQGATAQSALNSNSRTINQVIAAIERLGIAESAISTSGLNVSPQYNQQTPPNVDGYQVSNTITVNSTVKLAGQVIDQGVAAGANQVDGINFTSPGPSAYGATYRAAINDAHAQAEAIASALGERVIGARSVQVQSNSNPVPEPIFSAATANGSVLPGQQQETVTLAVVYTLGQ